jgi:hypothetical protein
VRNSESTCLRATNCGMHCTHRTNPLKKVVVHFFLLHNPVLLLDFLRRSGIRLCTLNKKHFLLDFMPNKKADVTLQSVFYSKRVLNNFLFKVVNAFAA